MYIFNFTEKFFKKKDQTCYSSTVIHFMQIRTTASFILVGGLCPGFSLEATFDKSLHVPFIGRKHVRTVMDAEDRHLLSILKILQQLWCYEEVLGGCLLTGCADHNVKDSPLIYRIHSLVDLVHHSEGAAVELLQGHEVKHCGDTALAPALMVGRQLVELSVAVKLHPNADPILIILLLIL